MYGRKNQPENYRFGFNGKENDTEYGSSQLVQDYGFRIYNPSIGRFLSVDPLTFKYPELTPYQFASNTPIEAIDLDGLEAYHVRHFYNRFGEIYRSTITVARSQNGQIINKRLSLVGVNGPIIRDGSVLEEHIGDPNGRTPVVRNPTEDEVAATQRSTTVLRGRVDVDSNNDGLVDMQFNNATIVRADLPVRVTNTDVLLDNPRQRKRFLARQKRRHENRRHKNLSISIVYNFRGANPAQRRFMEERIDQIRAELQETYGEDFDDINFEVREEEGERVGSDYFMVTEYEPENVR